MRLFYAPYSRRKFLTQASVAGLLWGCTESLTKPSDRPSSVAEESEDTDRIIIIGAGIAGIAAARSLQAKEYRVVILEGRDRIGGRMWTDTSLGVALDLGAAWIHRIEGNPIAAVAKQLGLPTVVSDVNAQWFYKGKHDLLKDAEQRQVRAAIRTFHQSVEHLKKDGTNLERISLADVAQQVIQDYELSGLLLKGFQAQLASDISSETGADLAELGIPSFNEDSEFAGPDVVFPKGYGQLIQRLATDLDIRTQHHVTQIAYDRNGVQVSTNRGVFTGARVIVTVPLGVLKQGKITFSPALPSAKQQAIQRLKMGALNKIVLKFPQQFWADEPHYMAYLRGDLDTHVEFWNWQKYVGEPILVGLVMGNFARSLSVSSPSASSPSPVLATMMSDLQAMFGQDIPQPTATLTTAWHNDPFTYGSYTIFPPAATAEDCTRLAEPVGDRLFFAGEATYSKYAATVHGAFLSGEREAARIISLDSSVLRN
jgi:monoamine oxidase